MPDHHSKIDETEQPDIKNGSIIRKPYHRPVLENLGDLRTLTLGSSMTGYKDSGSGIYSETFPTPIPPPPDTFPNP